MAAKTYLLSLVIASIISQRACGQIDHIRMMIGASDTAVTEYLDSLNSLKENKFYKIEKGVTDDGDLLFHCGFAINDESFYQCLFVYFSFYRAEGGHEICIRELIGGSEQYAIPQLNFVKDNFLIAGDNTWSKDWNEKFILVATFEKKEDSYSLFYELRHKK